MDEKSFWNVAHNDNRTSDFSHVLHPARRTFFF